MASRWAKRAKPGVGRPPASDSASDTDSSNDENAVQGSRFIPFGSVIDAIGASVRVTVACTAALAAELPVWGFRMRGDSEWMVRALRPEHCVILQEGDRAVLQADLSDADGRGMPSAERLMKATLIATPAMENTLLRAVDIQREGAADPAQHGATPQNDLHS